MKEIMIFIYWKILYNIFTFLPLQNKFFFESFLGRNFSDNPKAMYEYLLKHNFDYKYVWSLKEKHSIYGATVVQKMSIRYIYHLATSKYIINNSRMPLNWRKRKKQIYVQTWHGTPLKRLVHDMNNVTFPNVDKKLYFDNFDIDVKKWDFLLSPNVYSTNIFKKCFKYKGKILEMGYPRNEELLISEIEEKKIFKKKLGIPFENKVLLYTPTFRDNKYVKKGHYIQEIILDMQKIQDSLGDNITLILKNHYLIKEIDFKHSKDNIIDFSDYQNINELYKVSDILLTDYSSTFFDFLILNKPIVFYQYDQEEYSEDIRGFYIPVESLPGQVVTDEESLYDILKEVNLEKKVDYRRFLKKYGLENIDKESSKKVIEKILEENK